MQKRIYGVDIIIFLLQIVSRVCQWKNFENRRIIGEDTDKSKVARFLAHPVVCCQRVYVVVRPVLVGL